MTGVLHFNQAAKLAAVIHVILHRMWGHAVAVLFFLFQFEVDFRSGPPRTRCPWSGTHGQRQAVDGFLQ